MAYPLVPPPASDTGAQTFPRTLQRWLDVNPISKLTRVSSYITLPSFSQTVTWLGYSDIVASFNYEGPNNFSLTTLVGELPSTPNYVLCIMWKTSTNVVYRYALWLGVGEKFYFPVALYTGQKIGKNFRFEIWSTNNTPAVQTSSLKFYTSVLGKQDYRWASDFQLVTADAENTSFTINSVIGFPLALTVSGAGTAGANANYNYYQMLNGKPLYLSVGGVYLVSGEMILFASGTWSYVSSDLATIYYQSLDAVNDPTLITHWSYGNTPYPTTIATLPTTYLFNLPLVFPATSQPQPN